ncbi:MAG TPA: alpha/beta hydrolase [Solirubrobacteraceae bacterium]|jgi:acetyl esterase/lipase
MDVNSKVLGTVMCEELRFRNGGEDPVLLYLHGGGYVVGSPRAYRTLAGTIVKVFGGRALVVDYRLAPEHPHPAALEDVQAVWFALTEGEGVPPQRIVVAGDSAGGGLALALSLSLRDAGSPQPAALGLISPWTDLVPDLAGARPAAPGEVLLTPELARRFASAYLAGGTEAEHPYVSPLYAELTGLPPLVVHTGERELIRADGERLVKRAHAAGVVVSHEQLSGLWHDSHLSAALLSGPAAGAPARMAATLRAHLLRSG